MSQETLLKLEKRCGLTPACGPFCVTNTSSISVDGTGSWSA